MSKTGALRNDSDKLGFADVEERREVLHKTRAALDAIDNLIAGLPTDVARGVLNVLSALRGPDSDNIDAKNASTTWIRREALPLTCGKNPNGWDLYLTGPYRLSSETAHFNQHIMFACDALGLEPFPHRHSNYKGY